MRNEHIRAELGIFSINDKIEEQEQQWIDHVYIMDHQRLVKRAVDYKAVGRSSVGGPCKRWMK